MALFEKNDLKYFKKFPFLFICFNTQLNSYESLK